MKKYLFIFTLTIILMSNKIFAQDFHYSQFYAAPLMMNPGNTGVFNGDVRVQTLYRMQWFTVTNPYKTFSLAVDAPLFKKLMHNQDFFAAGVYINNDNQGVAKLKSNQYNLSLAFTKFIGGRQKHDITLGYQIGYVTRSVNLGGLTWDNQYDPITGTGNPNFASGETGGGGQGFIDMSTGLVWNFTTTHLFRSALGFSFHHFLAPNYSIGGGSDKLQPKLGVQWNMNYKLSETSNTTLEPSLMVNQQGPTLLINGGLSVKYVLQEGSRYTNYQSDKAIHIGAYYRFRDAFFVAVKYDYKDFTGSLAYDINVSKLTPASHTVGAIELMLAYKGIFGSGKNAKRSSTRFLN